MLFQNVGVVAQNEQLYIEYDFYFSGYFGDFTIESLSDATHNLQIIERKYNMQTSPGVVERLTDIDSMYRNQTDQTSVYEDTQFKNFVQEKLGTMKWDLTHNTMKILGYNCNEAKSAWRGRNYIAYFTTELPFKTAPWKFHGLPGVILKIFTTDGEFKVDATTVKLGQNLGIINNPFQEKHTISWEEYCEKYVAFEKKAISRMNALNLKRGYNLTFPGERIELITKNDSISLQIRMEKLKTK